MIRILRKHPLCVASLFVLGSFQATGALYRADNCPVLWYDCMQTAEQEYAAGHYTYEQYQAFVETGGYCDQAFDECVGEL